MLRHLHFALFVLLFGLRAFAQGNLSAFLPDTILPVSVTPCYYTALDSLAGDTVFVLDSPKGYIIRPHDKYPDDYIAIQEGNRYAVFNACHEVKLRGLITYERADFNGEGNQELMIRWMVAEGISSTFMGWSATSSGIAIWDLDKFQLLFEFKNSYNFDRWYHWDDPDSAGNLQFGPDDAPLTIDSVAVAESVCENYVVKIDPGKITIEGTARCKSEDMELYAYEWSDSRLLRKM